MTDRITRVARGVLAAAASVLPVALCLAPDAGADTPTVQVSSDGCSIVGTGVGFDQLRLSLQTSLAGGPIATSTGPEVTASYGTDWVLAEGDTVEVVLAGIIGGATVATDTVTVGTCMSGVSSILVSAANIGTPPPASDTYYVGLEPCGEAGGYPNQVAVTGSGPGRHVPVDPAVEYCPTIDGHPIGVGHLLLVPPVVTSAEGAVGVTADWLSRPVVLRKLFQVGAAAVDAQTAGVDHGAFGFTWRSFDTDGSELASGTCDLPAPSPGFPLSSELECLFPHVRPGGTLTVTEAGPAGWALRQSTFSESDCVDVLDGVLTSVVYCELTLVNDPVSVAGGDGGAPAAEPRCDAAASNPFSDLDESSAHFASVVCAADLGLVRGGPAGLPADRFGPTLTTSRAQLASLVANLLVAAGVELPAAAADAFADDDGSVHEGSIDALTALGVVGGNGDDGASFFPSREATRSEIASFLARAWAVATGAPLPAGPDAFGDDDGDPAEDAIDALAAAGLLAGKAPGVFDPTATVTREQIATLFVQLFEAMAG